MPDRGIKRTARLGQIQKGLSCAHFVVKQHQRLRCTQHLTQFGIVGHMKELAGGVAV